MSRDLLLISLLFVPAFSAQQPAEPPPPAPDMSVPAGAAAVEQTSQGQREAAALVASFDGLGESFENPRYSFGGSPHYAGQRFAGRLASDPPGVLTLHETVLVEGEAAQNAMRWEDYTQTAIDPSDDCTIWYVAGTWVITSEKAGRATRPASAPSACRAAGPSRAHEQVNFSTESTVKGYTVIRYKQS